MSEKKEEENHKRNYLNKNESIHYLCRKYYILESNNLREKEINLRGLYSRYYSRYFGFSF